MGSELLTSPPEGYIEWVKDIKERIRSAQQKAIFAANSVMISLYWQIGQDILERQGRQGWGAKVVDRLAADLRREFPEIKGFSTSNLKYMRRFAEECPNYQIGQQPVDQLPWSHIIRLITKIANLVEREWYAQAAIEYGWSRDVIVHQIESGLYHRHGKATTNVGISEYRLIESIPEDLQGSLPSIEQIEAELSEQGDESPKYVPTMNEEKTS